MIQPSVKRTKELLHITIAKYIDEEYIDEVKLAITKEYVQDPENTIDAIKTKAKLELMHLKLIKNDLSKAINFIVTSIYQYKQYLSNELPKQKDS